MSIKFLNLDKTLPVEKIRSTRPTGYKYPIGLHQFLSGSNAATNTTGGTQTIDGDNAVHTFTTSGTFIPSFTSNIEYLVVAGGGGGSFGTNQGGGGGAGGLLYGSNFPVTASLSVTVIIGAGGASSANGVNSSIGYVTANVETRGGGAGGTSAPGRSGGSGGGGGLTRPGSFAGGAGTSGQGNPGGSSAHIDNQYSGSGGGGGAGGPGQNSNLNLGGAGGVGLNYSISGSSVGYAGGGGGGGGSGNPLNARQIPFGGGGNPNGGNPAAGFNAGVANRGGGGAGRVEGGPAEQAGGSGVVIVRYQYAQNALTYFIE